jgi:hypothetical protein
MTNAHAILRGALVVLIACCGCSAPSSQERISTPATTTAAKPEGGVSLPFTILKRTREPKGGFTLLVVNAALTDASTGLTKVNVDATLRNLLQTVRREVDGPDGITAFLYQSAEHANGANAALGRAEWWPQGHTFADAANVRNKATHVDSIDVFSIPDTTVAKTNSRLTENVMREIFTALVKSEDRGTREAEARYPTNANNIPDDKLSTYDWKTVLAKNAEYEDTLQQKYQRELLAKYKISEAELDAIRNEASAQQWPLPR